MHCALYTISLRVDLRRDGVGVEKDSNFTCVYFVNGHSEANHGILVMRHSSAHLTFSVCVFVVLYVGPGVLFETADFDQGCTFQIRECKTEIPPCA
jgi:hypothetical protein